MKKISDFNNATEKYPVVYAGSATRPEFVDMPTTIQQQEGVAPMDTLPAQWWNAMWKLATRDINAFRDYVGDSITEINNLLTKFGITLDDANSEQLYDFFHNDYVQNYLNDIFINKSGDTIDGDLHVKGNLSVDGVGEEIVSTELKVGANTITLRNGNPTALGNTELAGVVTENYDGNNNNNIISIDKKGVARTGDIDIATRILYSNNGTNFFTDEELTIGATIGENEELRDTGNQTSSGVKIYEGVTYSNNDTQAIATREDNPKDGAFMKWDAASKKLVSENLGEASHRDVDTVVTADSENLPTSGAVKNALKDSTDRIADALDISKQGFGCCDAKTTNIPSNFAWGTRELKYISANQAIVKLTGVTKDGVAYYWFNIWNYGKWTGWAEMMKENSVINPALINVISNSELSGMKCKYPGVDGGGFYAWKNPNNQNEVHMTVRAEKGNINLQTPEGKTAYLNGLPIATVHSGHFYSGGQFTAAAKSQNILSVTDIEITKAGHYDVDMDFVTYGLGAGHIVWDYCSVFFFNKSTGAIISGHDLNQEGGFMYDLNAGIPIHNSSHGIRYLEPGHYGIRADVNKAGTYEAYLWIHGRS